MFSSIYYIPVSDSTKDMGSGWGGKRVLMNQCKAIVTLWKTSFQKVGNSGKMWITIY